jgi:hypothetical protein
LNFPWTDFSSISLCFNSNFGKYNSSKYPLILHSNFQQAMYLSHDKNLVRPPDHNRVLLKNLSQSILTKISFHLSCYNSLAADSDDVRKQTLYNHICLHILVGQLTITIADKLDAHKMKKLWWSAKKNNTAWFNLIFSSNTEESWCVSRSQSMHQNWNTISYKTNQHLRLAHYNCWYYRG